MSETTNEKSPEIKFGWLDVPRAIWRFLREDKRQFLTFNVILFSVFFYDLVPPYVVGKIVDFFTAYRTGQSLRIFYIYAVFLGVSYAFASLIRLGSKNILRKISIHARTRARIEGFERLTDFSLKWHSQEHSGSRFERINTGADTILKWVNMTNNQLYSIAVSMIGVLAAFSFFSTTFTVFTLIYMAFFFAIEFYYNRRLAELSNKINTARQAASGTFIESAGNMFAVKALGVEKNVYQRVSRAEQEAKRLMLERADVSTHKWYGFQILNGLATTIFILLIGQGVLANLISVGTIFVFVSYFSKIREATQSATEITTTLVELRSELGNMMPIFQETEVPWQGKGRFPNSWRHIKIKQGHFKYPSGHEGLKDLNFTIGNGEKVGVAGLSGSGKSTLVKILLGLYPLESGSFTIDDQDFYHISHANLLKHVAVVLQETELFNLSFQENITMLKQVDPRLLETAIHVAGLEELIARLPEGVATIIGEKGYRLSGGERQRVGIARAICKNADILILDEATSSLDSRTEKTVLDRLLSEFGQKKTFLIIAHRISTLKDTDRVVVFDGGGIVEEGTFDTLVAEERSHFGGLYRLQQKES